MNPIVVNAPRQIISELIYNLCDNAIKYNKDGGSVEVAYRRVKKKLVLTVKDTGIGIESEHHDRIFERFYRVDKSHSKEVGGTGLGLSIVKHDLNYLGGQVRIESKLGEGTCVEVVIPINR
jgi:two-component system phosphate regulon sensor histidine kinase PhoR